MCDMTRWRYTELWVVLVLEGSSALTKLIGIIDSIEVEDLVPKVEWERCERLRCRVCGCGVTA